MLRRRCGCCGRILFRRRRKRTVRRLSSKGSSATVTNGATIDGAISGLINIIVQVPVNLGDATSLSESNDNTLTNAL